MRWAERIEQANRLAASKLASIRPVWIDVVELRHVVDGLGEHSILHAGPPIAYEMAGQGVRSALDEHVVRSGWSDSVQGARNLIESGSVHLLCHTDLGGSAFGRGFAGPRDPVFVVEDAASHRRSYAVPVVPPSVDAEAWRTSVAPTLARALQSVAGIPLLGIMERALSRGDDLHVRSAAATSMLVSELVLALLQAGIARRDMEAVVKALSGDEAFFAPLSLAVSRLSLESAAHVDDSTLITNLVSNGDQLGLRVAGSGAQWFTAPIADAVGVGAQNHAMTAGDDAIVELLSLGAASLHLAPLLWDQVDFRASDAEALVRELNALAIDGDPLLPDPPPGKRRGIGFDLRRVVELGVAPLVVLAGDGTAGPSYYRVPLRCFRNALRAFADERGIA